ncbi:MAG TPA: DEAD/DEAH box helicase [candidate division Zixibacteria bacterium]|nr:DEAD/DEAH box helicase [candidate division Zixibacteria bacterium]
MDVFHLRKELIADYKTYTESFVKILDPRIHDYVAEELESGALWPDPLLQLNPRFEQGKTVDEFSSEGILHPLIPEIFRFGKSESDHIGISAPLHKHQSEAIEAASSGDSYVLITGTGSGKSLAYIIPIVDYALKNKDKKGIKAIIIYPMNALANSQLGELRKFLEFGFEKPPVTFARYTGQENDQQRMAIKANPPDILLTNYVMMEYIMTRPDDEPLVRQMRGMQFLVLDELHTYRGRQGADVSMLARRVREVTDNPGLQVVGTSATLAGGDTFAEQQVEVAKLATKVFGVEVKPTRIIGETLTRLTRDRDLSDPHFVDSLRDRLAPGQKPPVDRESFIEDPLSSWIETVFGLESEPGSDRLRRSAPITIESAAERLSEMTGVAEPRCIDVIREALLAGYYWPKEPVFAFRLHQFISRGDAVFASLDEPANRYLSLSGQQFVPGDRARRMLPLAFCRECGQEYYVVTRWLEDGHSRFVPRELRDQGKDSQGQTRGYLYRNPDRPWLHNDPEFVVDNVPDSWVIETEQGRKLTKTGRKKTPLAVLVDTSGQEDPNGALYHFILQPFEFCLSCGVAYSFRLRGDYAKLTTLSAGGRSTATTVLALSAIRTMQQEQYLKQKARKLLSFTDNRQDASLQAGHTNDFVEVGLLRSALYRAVAKAGEEGIEHDVLPQQVFNALALPFNLYAVDPSVAFGREEFHRALREVLGYRLYHDLRRGWRVTAPNLEQTGLLKIDYKFLSDICVAEDYWQDAHAALATALPETREKIARVLLDWMRRELAINVDYLRPDYQESLQRRSNQYLVEPWSIDDVEVMTGATIAYPCTQTSLTGKKRFENVYVSEYGGFGQYLRRLNSFPEYSDKLNMVHTLEIIRQLLERLKLAALVTLVRESVDGDGNKVPGYQVRASSFIWKAGDGTVPYHDPIRVPRLPKGGGETNPFFIAFYSKEAAGLLNVRAREHTAQVPNMVRQKREDDFREARLPILYCSPTMELGVDIAQLNVVNMRNVPPTPANYAQRSGRAGRSGQPALVFTYCTTGSPHDQYHFKRPERMVGGKVSTPRLDLANEDLILAHVHALWLSETGVNLGKSLKDVLDLNDLDKLPVFLNVLQQLSDPRAQKRGYNRAKRILATIEGELENASWYDDQWLERRLSQAFEQFDRACHRWRGLFQAAREQQRIQNEIARDPSRPEKDKRIARQLRREAETQLSLLTDESSVFQGDFYSYRYFASEGFLPGYNFPRLPLSAYIPARRGMGTAEDEFVNRPRFLAITEFGPRSIIYHEGSRYIINKVIMPVGELEAEEGVLTTTAKLCSACGYLHPIDGEHDPDICDHCRKPLTASLHDLFRMQNVSTRRRDRISSDEEERLRQGYEVISGARFGEHQDGQRVATVLDAEGTHLWNLAYGELATIWRINLGWKRRENKNELGFWLDTERGYWQSNKADVNDDADDPMSARLKRVIPFVADNKNALLLEPPEPLPLSVMASLQSAIQKAIQAVYQLEDNELAVEPLPARDKRNLILVYEASEGGAGVLKQLLEDPGALPAVAEEALRICHFDPADGTDLRRAPGAHEECEAACYDCLLSYYNQMDHLDLDRQLIREHLLALKDCAVTASPGTQTRLEHLERLRTLTGSELEREWLEMVNQSNLRLPNAAQYLVESCNVRPDFYYDVEDVRVAIFIDGPHHDQEPQKSKDKANDDNLFLTGIESVRFHYKEKGKWPKMLSEQRAIFGAGK